MTAPLYRDASRPREAPPGCNLGLWYTRFFDSYGPAWRLDETAKRRWIDDAVTYDQQPRRASAEAYARRRVQLVRSSGGELRELETCWHFATGLGLPHPVENGFTWHQTLGLPCLQATGIKGLLAAWLHLVKADQDEPEERRRAAERRQERWCGTQEQAGSLIYFDAFPTTDPELTADVMTPHMGQWYAKGATISNLDREPEKVPADWHSPIPVPFLVVKRATFLFGIAPRPGARWQDRDPKKEVGAALDELEKALEVLGAGAKTAIGYGRFERRDLILARIEREMAEKARNRAEARARAAKLARFDGFDPPVSEIIGDEVDGGIATKVLQAMNEDKWSREDCRRLAESLASWLRERGEWIEDARNRAGKAGKDKKNLADTRGHEVAGRVMSARHQTLDHLIAGLQERLEGELRSKYQSGAQVSITSVVGQHPLVQFLFRLLRRLQTLATAPAIDYGEYLQAFEQTSDA